MTKQMNPLTCMSKAIKRMIMTSLAMLVTLSLAAIYKPPLVYADVPYYTYYKDHYGEYYEMQAAYIPSGIMGQSLYVEQEGKLVHSPLQQPQDLFIDIHD